MYKISTKISCKPRVCMRQILLVMKLTTVLMIATFLQVSAATFAQKVTLKKSGISINDVFKEIRKQTGYHVLWDPEVLKANAKIDANFNNAPLEEVMASCLDGKELTYTIDEKTILIKQKEISFLDKAKEAVKDFFANIDVTGLVLDEQGLPISSATVTVKGTSNATITDAAGYFNLHNVDDKAILVISVIGYDKKEIPAAKNIGAVKLVVAVNKLDELQIIAYGQTSQRLTTGNVSSVSSTVISEQPVTNPLLALEGRVPGLVITQVNGINGGGVTVRIQGQNSINGGNYPLYVIDGIPYQSQMLSTVLGGPLGRSDIPGNYAQFNTATQGNPLSYINPADIENIEVLKDADATSIYGSRAANGAILITTKKGKAGTTKVDVNLQNGWSVVSRGTDMMNTQQYLQMRNEAFRNDGLIPSNNPAAKTPYLYAPDLTIWDTTRFTDWRKVLIGKSAQYTNYNASVSGGNASTQYLIGTSYNKNGTVFPGDFSDQKGSLHFNINNVSANQKFHLNFSGSYLFDNNFLPQTDPTATAYRLAPDAPALYNSDGTLNWAYNAAGTKTWTNPIASTLATYQNKTTNLLGNILLSYTILPGLDVKSTFGYNDLETNEFYATPLNVTDPVSQTVGSRQSRFSNNDVNTWQIEPQINFKHTLWKGNIDALLGSTFLETKGNGTNYSGIGYNSDALLSDIKSASTITLGTTTSSVYKYNAFFGRLNYNLFDKYILNVTARRDGSSRFGPDNEFHDFWSTGGAWIFSQENLIKNNLPFLSFGKLKASYGTTGSDQIGNYNYLNLYNSAPVGIPYQNIVALAPNGIPNPNLKWEETHKMSLGIDIGILKDRILVNASYNRNRSSNELLQYVLPYTTGALGVVSNFPATIQNTSLEFGFNTTNIKSKDFTWNSSFNLTIPKNKLVSFQDLATSAYASVYVIGQPVNLIKVTHFLGVDPATGTYRVADQYGNPTSSPSFTDQTEIINTNPKFYGGLQNSFIFKGIKLDVFIQFTKQLGLASQFFGNGGVDPGVYNSGGVNQPLYVLNRWQKPGDISSIQRYTTSSNALFSYDQAVAGSDGIYTDASFIKLKNVSLSYELPVSWKHRIHLENCRIFMQGQNLLTFSKYPGVDPETQGLGLPTLKVITFGIQVGL